MEDGKIKTKPVLVEDHHSDTDDSDVDESEDPFHILEGLGKVGADEGRGEGYDEGVANGEEHRRLEGKRTNGEIELLDVTRREKRKKIDGNVGNGSCDISVNGGGGGGDDNPDDYDHHHDDDDDDDNGMGKNDDELGKNKNKNKKNIEPCSSSSLSLSSVPPPPPPPSGSSSILVLPSNGEIQVEPSTSNVAATAIVLPSKNNKNVVTVPNTTSVSAKDFFSGVKRKNNNSSAEAGALINNLGSIIAGQSPSSKKNE